MNFEDFKGKKIIVMGLGLNGGGLASARFLSELGAHVCATDLRSAEILKPSIEKLQGLDIEYVLGEHRIEDFKTADMVIKNPAVPLSSPFLKAAAKVETDISLFLQLCSNPIIAVTGSKGKSTIVSALHHILKRKNPGCQLGGNITRSPLSFLKDLHEDDPVILELSSWQLGDIKGRHLLHPRISVLSNIMNDHQNMYDDFEDYVDDKKEIFRSQDSDDYAIFLNDDRGRIFAEECNAQSFFYSTEEMDQSSIFMNNSHGFMKYNGALEELLPEELKTPGLYFRQNCLIAASIALLYGMDKGEIRDALTDFPGVPHRLELVQEINGIRYYNDTTATIPEAMAAAVESFTEKTVHLICGGTDKELDYSGTPASLRKAEALYLLEGSASDKLKKILDDEGIPYHGPYGSLQEAFEKAEAAAAAGQIILMSPGATSFGMFINEFDRGDSFRRLAEKSGSSQKSGYSL